ncbi:hypothetical protein [Rahnella aceris]|uniref:hypothetical protein n=1 Tax=Rahnella sp. (strain Y9602) TaxID=2703885 RepID=UPI001C27EF6B|nr:hypothetical protein [Rahnella aceris]MBU9858528.1 hypothetical protein [Rahnella aceris]
MALSKYSSTRTVQAMKIESLQVNPDFSAILNDADGTTIIVSREYVLREKPSSGGYYMKDSDGFESYIIRDIFEDNFSA